MQDREDAATPHHNITRTHQKEEQEESTRERLKG
jgi:hypothetical protein